MKKHVKNTLNEKTPVNRRVGRRDILLLIVVFVVLLFVFAGAKLAHRDTGSEVIVKVDDTEVGRYPLDQEAEIPIENEDGNVTNHLLVKNGAADMSDADCPDQLCVHQKAISHQGETIVCLPNKVVVSIEGGNQGLVDTVAQ